MPRKSHSPQPLRAHFIGIGGIGISALARWFLAQNWSVSGSDQVDSAIIRELRKEGVQVKIGHKKANLGLKNAKRGLNMVIYSAAISQSNPEIQEARKRGLKPLSFPEVMGCLTRLYKTIAIAGMHGKSTSAAMAALVLIKAGINPTVILGTKLKEFKNKNFRKGKGEWLIFEADEWKASFLNYSPIISVITNIDKEHLDYYKNLAAIKSAFLKFINKTQSGGALILNRDDKNLRSLRSPIRQIAKRKSLRVIWYSIRNSKIGISPSKILRCKTWEGKFADWHHILKIPGGHNVSNALAVLCLAEILKIRKPLALKALSEYRGAWRRMEFKGNAKFIIHNSKFIIPVYDDYAHHPTEIKATLQAFRENFPKSKIICIYQPHQAKRLKALFKEFVDAFNLADILILLPVYEVAGRDKASSTYTSKKLASAIARRLSPTSHGPTRKPKEVIYLSDPRKIKVTIIASLRKSAFSPRQSALVVMMGAGDIVNYTPLLLKNSKS